MESSFAEVAPYMTIECSELKMKNTIVRHLKGLTDMENRYHARLEFGIADKDFQKINFQFKALGLITMSIASKILPIIGH